MRRLIHKTLNNRQAVIACTMLCLAALLVGCDGQGSEEVSGASTDVVLHDGNLTSEVVQNLNKTQPIPTFTYSLERDNLIGRLKLWNQPNKISYIVLFSYGKVVMSFTVKGKVSSVNSLITNPQQIVNPPNAPGAYAMPSPDLDGSYGENPSGAIFFFTTEGRYVEWKGDYLWTDQPLTVQTPPQVTVNVKG